MTSRVLLVFSLVSIVTAPAHSQQAGPPAANPAPNSPGNDDDEATGSGAGSALIAPTDPKARPVWLKQQMQAAIDARPLLAAKAKIGVAVVDITTGTELFARAADQKMSLASNAKLLTATAALGTLGSGFRWRTSVFVDDKTLDEATGVVKGDLYLRGH